jgi:hypothetical protein
MFPFDLFSLEILLPFFLVLAIIYGALEVSKVFDNRAVKGIIAVVFAFFAVMNSQVVAFINAILPYAAGFFVILFLIWIVLKPFRGGGRGGDATVLIVILVLVLVLLANLGSAGYTYGFLTDPNFLWLIGIIVVLVIIWKAYKMGKE